MRKKHPAGNTTIVLIFLIMLCAIGFLAYSKREFITEKLNTIQEDMGSLKDASSNPESGSASTPGSQTPTTYRPVVATAPLHAGEYTYHEFIKRNDVLVLVDFYADWCGPCRTLAPHLEKLAAEHGDKVIVVKINVETEEALATKVGVRSIPDVRLFHDGKVLYRAVGADNYKFYEDLILSHAKRLPAPQIVPGSPGQQGESDKGPGSIEKMEKGWLPPGIEKNTSGT